MIKVDAVTKKYDDATVLDTISITFGKPEIVGLVGENGGGKTTLLRILAHKESVDSGSVHTDGETIGYLPQTPSFAQAGPI